MIDKNKIGEAIVDKLDTAAIVTNIAYENTAYDPSGNDSFVLVAMVPAIETPDSRCTESAMFSVDFDVYVKADMGIYSLRETIKDIGDLFNPLTDANARWIVEDQELRINSVEEVQGAKTDDGWFYSTLRLNVKVNKSI